MPPASLSVYLFLILYQTQDWEVEMLFSSNPQCHPAFLMISYLCAQLPH